MRLSVIIPARNAATSLPHCLGALAASTRPPDEIIVVDNGSTDGTGDLARQHGACVIHLDGPPRGAGPVRNQGAGMAQGDVLVFVDSDVAVHSDALARFEQVLAGHPEIAAVFGSYDDRPPSPGLAARYKNLLNHYTHHHSPREASTFWTACGAVRRQPFLAVGGFDPNYRMLEDIALGSQLRQAGQRIWLCPDIQATHLKRWTLYSLIRSDILDRAIPWTRIIIQNRHLPAELNLNARSRLSALDAWATVAGLVLGFWLHWAWPGALLAGVGVIALNADLYRFFLRRGGIGFAAGAVGLHLLYLLYSPVVFVLIAGPAILARWCGGWLPGRRR
jgi:glycosyltransferase involved in cell wall biosynthesis